MKLNVLRIAVSLALVSSAGAVLAGSVTGLTSFTTGTPAKATEVNDNFTAVKTAVDDNYSRVTAVQNQTQNLATGCPAGQSIRAVAGNGSVTCQVDNNTTYSAGQGISITGQLISSTLGADISVEPAFTSIAAGSTAVVPVATVSITVPSSGFILVTHTGVAVLFGQPNEVKVGIGSTPSAFSTSANVGVLDGTSGVRYQLGYNASQLFTAGTPGTYTFYGLAQKNTTFNAGSVNVVPQSLSAMFIPNKL
jgi:hypothetical protein